MGEIFSYRVTKDEKVLIYWQNKLITTLKGGKAQKFMRQIDEAESAEDVQLVMARVTGNFKRGNERNTSPKWS
jgi:hypothetical protein